MITILYIISEGLRKNKVYTAFETETSSVLKLSLEEIRLFIEKCNIELKNAKIENNKLIMNKWPGNFTHDYSLGRQHYENIIIAKMYNGMYKMINCNGRIMYKNTVEIRQILEKFKIENLNINDVNGESYYKVFDCYEIKINTQLENEINQKYNKYMQKSKLLGLDTSFRYKIENDNIILTEYTGTSNRIVIPNFITSIQSSAFYSRALESVSLNTGLRSIGTNAFIKNNIQSIDIPETVRFICEGAFDDNIELFKAGKSKMVLDETKIKFNNDSTLVMDIEYYKE